MTRQRINSKGEGMVFADTDEVLRAYGARKVDLQAQIKVRINETVNDADGHGLRNADC